MKAKIASAKKKNKTKTNKKIITNVLVKCENFSEAKVVADFLSCGLNYPITKFVNRIEVNTGKMLFTLISTKDKNSHKIRGRSCDLLFATEYQL